MGCASVPTDAPCGGGRLDFGARETTGVHRWRGRIMLPTGVQNWRGREDFSANITDALLVKGG